MNNITLTLEAPDYRPAFVFDDVSNVEIINLQIEGEEKRYPIVLRQAKNISIDDRYSILKL
jgi:hypothetical protein